MEQDQNQSLFSLNVDSQSKAYLQETAKWGTFLSIIGFIGCALIILAGIFMAVGASQFDRSFNEYGGRSRGLQGLGTVMAFAYILFAVLYFFPCLYLMRFSSHIKAAVASDDQANLTVAFQNLKSLFKFVGILTIIGIALYILVIIIALGTNM